MPAKQYKPEYCQIIILYAAKGETFTQFAKDINVHRISLSRWARRYPDFKEALEKAWKIRKSYQEKINRLNKAKLLLFKKKRRPNLLSCWKRDFEKEIDPETEINLEENDPSVSDNSRELPKKKIHPSDNYKPEYCQEVIRFGENGGTLSDFCAAIGIGRVTLYRWAARYPEFNEAVDLSRDNQNAYWLKLIKESVNKKFNFRLWQTVMISQFGYKSIYSRKKREPVQKKTEQKETSEKK